MLPSILITSPIKVFVEPAVQSCSVCTPQLCQCILRQNDSGVECDGILRYHKAKEIFYFNNTKLFMEDALLPFVHMKNAEDEDEYEEEEYEEEEVIPVLARETVVVFIVVFCLTFVALLVQNTEQNISTRRKHSLHSKKKSTKTTHSHSPRSNINGFSSNTRRKACALGTNHSSVSLDDDLKAKTVSASYDESEFTQVSYKSLSSWC